MSEEQRDTVRIRVQPEPTHEVTWGWVLVVDGFATREHAQAWLELHRGRLDDVDLLRAAVRGEPR